MSSIADLGVGKGTAPLEVLRQDHAHKSALAGIEGEQPPLPPELEEFAHADYQESEPVSDPPPVIVNPPVEGDVDIMDRSSEAHYANLRRNDESKHLSEPPPPEPTEPVVFEHPDFRIEFKVFEVSVIDRQIGLKVPKEAGFVFKPKVDSNYTITYRRTQYRVSYLGGTFQFGADSAQIITFLIYENDAEERPDRSREDTSRELRGS